MEPLGRVVHKKMAIDAEERQLRADYDLRTSQYLAAKADLPEAAQGLAAALAEQNKCRQELEIAQAADDIARQRFRDA